MANERLSLIIESQTRGTAEVDKLIAALDRLSNVSERSSKKSGEAATKAERDLQRFSASIKGAIQDPLGAAGAAAEKFALSIGKIGVVGVAVTLGLQKIADGAGAVFSTFARTAKAAEEVTNFADRLGITTGAAAKLRAEAKIAGVEIGTLEGATRTLAAALEDTSGAGEKANDALRKLGIQTVTSTGQQRELGVIVLGVLESLSKIPSTSERVALAQQTLGRGSRELLPLIKNYENLKKAVEDLGIGLDSGLIDRLGKADDRLDKLSLRWDEFLKRLAGNVGIPVLDSLERFFTFAPAMLNFPREAAGRVIAGTFGQSVGGINGPSRTPLPGQAPGFLAAAELQARSSGLAAGFRSSQTDVGGLTNRLEAIKKDREEARRSLGSGALSPEAFTRIKGDFDRLGREEAQLGETLRRIELAKKSGTFEAKFPDNPIRPRGPSLFGLGQRGLANLPSFEISEADIAAANAGVTSAAQGQLAARGAGIVSAGSSARERDLAAARQLTEFQARRVQLLAGPGGEVAAIERSTAIKLAGLQAQKELGEDLFEIEKQRTEILQDRELQLMELQKARLDSFKAAAGNVFDALIAGGSGVRGFASGLGLTTGRTIFQNVAGIAFGGSTGKLSLPGTGTAENPSLLGKILSGTPFGPKSSPLDRSASLLDKAAFDLSLAARVLSGGGANFTALSNVGGFNVGSIFGGATNNPLIFNHSGVVGDIPGGVNAGLPGGALATLSGAKSGTSNFSRGVGFAGIGFATALGVKNGIDQGGAQGALVGGSSLAGGAAGILALAGVTGPAAPILAAVGIGLAVGASLLGNPKERRSREIEQEIRDRQSLTPFGIDAMTDQFGSGLDLDKRGNFRRGAPIIVVNQNFDMLDGRQIIDRRADFVDAMRQAVQDGGADAFVDDFRNRLVPA